MSYNVGDVFIVGKKKTYVGMIVGWSEITPVTNLGQLRKLVYWTGDCKYTKKIKRNFLWSNDTDNAMTIITSLSKLQMKILRKTLRWALQEKWIDNLEYIEALENLKKYGHCKTRTQSI
jgi:hypothetical protein